MRMKLYERLIKRKEVKEETVKDDVLYPDYVVDMMGNKKRVVSYDERMETSVCSKRGLYVGDLVLLDLVHRYHYPLKTKKYPLYMWNVYGIYDVEGHLKRLEEQGFLRRSLDIENCLVYKLSETGMLELKENAYVSYLLNRNYALDVFELNRKLNGNVALWKDLVSVFEEDLFGVPYALYFDERYYLETGKMWKAPLEALRTFSKKECREFVVFYNSNKERMMALSCDEVDVMKYETLAKWYMSVGEFQEAALYFEASIRKGSLDSSVYECYVALLKAYGIEKKAMLVMKKCQSVCLEESGC